MKVSGLGLMNLCHALSCVYYSDREAIMRRIYFRFRVRLPVPLCVNVINSLKARADDTCTLVLLECGAFRDLDDYERLVLMVYADLFPDHARVIYAILGADEPDVEPGPLFIKLGDA